MIPAEVEAALPAAFDRAKVTAYALVRCALDSPLGESHLIASSAHVVVVTRGSSFEPFRLVELEDLGVRYEREAFSRTLTLRTREGREHRLDVSILDVASVEAFVSALEAARGAPSADPSPASSPSAPAVPSISSPLPELSSPFPAVSPPYPPVTAPLPQLSPSLSPPLTPIAPEPVRLSPTPPLLASLPPIAPPSLETSATNEAGRHATREELVTLLALRAEQLRAKPRAKSEPKTAPSSPAHRSKPKPTRGGTRKRNGAKPKPIRARRDELEAQRPAAALDEREAPAPAANGSDAPLFNRNHLIALLVGVPLLWTLAQLVARLVVRR